MPERGIVRAASQRGYATPTNAPIRVDTTTNQVLVNPNGSGTTEVPLMVGSVSGAKIVAGTGTLVTGAATINTGLTTIISASADSAGQPTGTGTASAQLLAATWVTGALTITAYSISSITGATTAASTSTGSFTWLAIGV